MKLQYPAVEFRRFSGALYAKSTLDHRWYKVQGITKTLDSVMSCRSRVYSRNMINMDLFTRLVKDLTSNSEGALEWVTEYARHLNAPDHKALELKNGLLQILSSNKAPSLEACRRLWDRIRMSASIGVSVDAECKDVFNGRREKSEVGPVSRLILTQLEALRLTPMCAGLKVAGIPSPDRVRGRAGSYTYHNECREGCTDIGDKRAFYTEVDLVAHDTVTDTVALLEVKTRHNDVLDQATLWRYNTQLWLTWVMFSLTYPSVAERSTAYLVIIRPGTNQVRMRSCMRPTLSKTMRDKFPWLTCFCSQVLNCLAPTCVNMRVATRLAAAAAAEVGTEATGRLDPSDLCYRNMLFNQEKRKS